MQKRKQAFTLIELLIAITIMVLMATMSYAPYSVYKNKSQVKLASRELAQSFYEAKNMAVSGVKTSSGSDTVNASIGVYLDGNTPSEVSFYAFPYTSQSGTVSRSDGKIVKTKKLQDNTNMDIGATDTYLIFYESITGNTAIIESFGSPNSIVESLEIPIKYSTTTSNFLKTKIKLHGKTNVVDYNVN